MNKQNQEQKNKFGITNKKGILMRDVLVAGILFSGIVALFVLHIASISSEYESTALVNEQFSNNYDKLTEQTNRITKMQTATTNSSGLSTVGTFDVFFTGTFTVIALVFSTLETFGNMANSFATDFGFELAPIQIGFVIGLASLTIYLVFIWISSITRGRL